MTMPQGTMADFKIYDEQFYGGQYEYLAQNLNIFNGASNGAFVLASDLVKGEFEREAFLKNLAAATARRDPTSIAGVADQKLTMDEFVGVKANGRFGPFAQTLDSWKKIAEDPEQFSLIMGRVYGQAKLADFVNTAVAAAVAGLRGQAALLKTVANTITHGDIVNAIALRGDAANEIACFVMHSKQYFDLVGQAITDKIFGVANVTIYSGTVATFGKPTIVTDAPGLITAGAPNTYNMLALVPGAVTVKESEKDSVVSQPVTGQENISLRIQGEYAMNISLKGMKWDAAGAAGHPTDAALATSANWIKAVAQDKGLLGVCLNSQ
jgi:hypothetical protein